MMVCNWTRSAFIRVHLRLWLCVPALTLAQPALARAQAPIPPLPDSTGWGVHVLAVARDARGAIWVGTYGHGIYRLPVGATVWEPIRHDSTETSISWDFVQALTFGARGQIWYGTIGNGWGLSTDGGATWKNWAYKQLGPEWQYVTPSGIVVRGDTTVIGTADGLQVTTNDGANWTALADATGPPARGPADTVFRVLRSEYVRRVATDRRGWNVATLRGSQRLRRGATGWQSEPLTAAAFPPGNALLIGKQLIRGTQCGLKPATDTLPCLRQAGPAAEAPRTPLTTWFKRPIALTDNSFIDQTYRYGSTMGGNFQQHQGVEFNNPDGTPVYAIGAGTVVYAGPAEAGALTVTIRHDTPVTANGKRYRIFSTYYHNSALAVKVGRKVTKGALIARVGNTGRATNDHLHLEISASPSDSIAMIVDSLQRFPPYTSNPELWIEPLPGTGIIAGQVLDASGAPVQQARIYGITKRDPVDTPFSFAETYGDKAHPHPLYGEHFAVSDVPPGSYTLGTEIGGQKVFRQVVVEEGKLTWVVFRP
ncbi:MAG TPA: peptidoglycan DD-metalloendopeptidase family protein [Gemmatimonadales bacterium]|nr:peptidoglycan DD-metalloendopeptidase family protein [Gemmatimonadales bacterium]